MRKFLVIMMLSLAIIGGIVSVKSVSAKTLSPTAVNAITVCQQYDRTIGATLSYGKLTAKLCYNGSQAWVASGVGCSQIVLPPFGMGTVTWCGISANNSSYAEVGQNYTINAFGGQFTQYVRMRLYANGSVSTYGGI